MLSPNLSFYRRVVEHCGFVGTCKVVKSWWMAMILSGQVLMAGIMTIEVKSRNFNDDGLTMKPVRCHIDPQKLSFNQLCP